MNQKKENRFFIQRKNASMPITFRFNKDHSDKVSF
jgi:hypothetical protein